MTLENQQEFVRLLQKKMTAMQLQSTTLDGPANQIGKTVRMLAVLTEEGDAALMEVMITPFSEEEDLMMFFSTIYRYETVDDELAGELMVEMSDWNMTCPLGNFGFYDEEQQVYHKYSILIDPNESPETLAAKAMNHLEVLYEVVNSRFQDIVDLDESE